MLDRETHQRTRADRVEPRAVQADGGGEARLVVAVNGVARRGEPRGLVNFRLDSRVVGR